MATSTREAVVLELLKAFRVPDHCVSLNIDIQVDSVVSVTCEYYPTLELTDGELVKVLKRYKLVEKDENG